MACLSRTAPEEALPTTVVRVTGPQYAPAEMYLQTPDPGRTGRPTAWLTRAGASDGCCDGSDGYRPATIAYIADDVEREPLTPMRSAPSSPADVGSDGGQGRHGDRYGDACYSTARE